MPNIGPKCQYLSYTHNSGHWSYGFRINDIWGQNLGKIPFFFNFSLLTFLSLLPFIEYQELWEFSIIGVTSERSNLQNVIYLGGIYFKLIFFYGIFWIYDWDTPWKFQKLAFEQLLYSPHSFWHAASHLRRKRTVVLCSFISQHNQPTTLRWLVHTVTDHLGANSIYSCGLFCLNNILPWHKQDLLTLAQQKLEVFLEHAFVFHRERLNLNVCNGHHLVKVGLGIAPKFMISWEPGVRPKITAFITITLEVNKTHLHTLFHLILTIILWSRQDRNFYCYISGKETKIEMLPLLF